jgi:hypothetical protein
MKMKCSIFNPLLVCLVWLLHQEIQAEPAAIPKLQDLQQAKSEFQSGTSTRVPWLRKLQGGFVAIHLWIFFLI